MVGRPGGQVLGDIDGPSAEPEMPRPEAGCRYGIGDHDAAGGATGRADVVTQREEGDVHAVGNESDAQAIRKAQGALDDVVMAVHLHRAAIAQVRE